MAQIKQFTRDILPTQLTNVRAPASAFGADQSGAFAAAGAFSGAARAVSGVDARLEEIQLKKDESNYIEQLSALKLGNIRERETLRNSSFEAGTDLSEAYMTNLNDRASQLEVPESQQARFQVDLANMELGFAQDGVREQSRRAGVTARVNFENTLDNAMAITAQDPLDHEEARRLVRAQVQSLPGAPEDRAKMLDAAFDSIQSTRAGAVLAANPNVFKEMVSAGDFNDLPNLQKFIQSADGAINRQQKEAAKNAEETNLLNDAINGTSYLDPANSAHKKALDKHYQAFSLGEEGNLNDSVNAMNPLGAEMALQFSEKFKIIPESLQSTLRGMTNGGGPEERQFAYDLTNELKVSGAVGFTEKEVADANTYGSLVSTGYTAKEAIGIIDTFNGDDFDKLRQVREVTFAEKFKGFDSEQKIKDFFDPSVFVFEPDFVSEEAIVDFNTALKQEFLKTNKIESAEAAALQIINRKYGVSRLMGGREVISYPPEKFGHPALTPKENRKWMRSALQKDLKALGVTDELDKYKLFSISENKDFVQSGQPPMYYIINEDNDFVRNEDNSPLLYFFDTNIGASVAKSREEGRQKKITNRATRERAVRDIQLDPTLGPIDKFLAKRAADAIDILDAVGLGGE